MHLLDSRLADDILLFARPVFETVHMLDKLLNCLDDVGLLLNAEGTASFTTEARPPAQVSLTGPANRSEFLEKSQQDLDATQGIQTCNILEFN